MFAALSNVSRPVLFGGAGALLGMMFGKTKKQKNQLALGYGLVGAVAGAASARMMQEEAGEAAEAAAAGFGELELMDGYGVPAVSPASTVMPPTAPTVTRRIRGRRRLPYRRVTPPRAPYAPVVTTSLPPRRIFRARRPLPYRRITPPRAAYRPAPYFGPYRRPPYRPAPYYPYRPYSAFRRGPRGYYGPALTRACQLLLAKIQRMKTRIARGLPVFKMDRTPLSQAEAPVYLNKLIAAYRYYCASPFAV